MASGAIRAHWFNWARESHVLAEEPVRVSGTCAWPGARVAYAAATGTSAILEETTVTPDGKYSFDTKPRAIKITIKPPADGAQSVNATWFKAVGPMALGEYALAKTLMPTKGVRKITITHALTSTVDTLGTIKLTGTDVTDAIITETVAPVSGGVRTSTKFFKTLTKVESLGWVAVAGADTISIGVAAGLTAQWYNSSANVLTWTGGTAVTVVAATPQTLNLTINASPA